MANTFCTAEISSDFRSGKIAVVGMAGWYPGAQSLRQFWENILTKRQQFREMVDCRLPLSEYYDPDVDAPDKTYGRNAAYIENFDFDWNSKRIPKSAVESSDIVHWLSLEVALKALSDANYTKQQVKGSNTAVILGNTLTGEWSRSNSMRTRWPFVHKVFKKSAQMHDMDDSQLAAFLSTAESVFKSVFPPVDEDTLAGALSNTVAGRVCNYLDLHGGGYTVDGACASSLLAVINGAKSLVLNEVDMVFAGGVDISLDTFELIGFAKTGALTLEEMRVYDDRASGFIPGEGCGFVILKRFEDALAAKDQIYAVINGWGISSDGKGSITAPSIKGQARALRSAYRMAGYDASQLDFVEGHGTGTPVGDRVELLAIQEAMEMEPAKRSVGLTSLKSVLGHTKAAAGIGAFIKTVIAVNRRVLPPTSGIEVPRDVFRDQAEALYPLIDGEVRLATDVVRAGVSAMGFGGINTHVTCESFAEPSEKFEPFINENVLLAHPQDSEVFVFGSSSHEGLRKQLIQLADDVRSIAKAEVVDLAADLAYKVSPDAPVRGAFVADTPAMLKERIQALISLTKKGAREGTYVRDEQNTIWLSNWLGKRRLAFMFPGQGSQRINMARPLIRRFDWAAQWVKDCEAYAEALSTPHLASRFLLNNAQVLPESAVSSIQAKLAQTEIAQPSICLSSLIWHRFLSEAGVKPVAVGGHSLGELTAIYAGGVCDEQTLLHLASRRGYEMAASDDEQKGKMAALMCTREQAEALLAQVSGYVTIANINGPEQIVVSGKEAAVDAVVDVAKDKGVSARELPVSHAFHSSLMGGAAERYAAEFADVKGRVSGPKLFSCMDGRAINGPMLMVGEHLQQQMLAHVDFVALTEALAEEAELVIEVGPGRVLSDMFGHIVNPGRALALPVEPRPGSAKGLNEVLAAVHVFGHELNWRAVYANRLLRPYIPASQRQFIENPCERELRTVQPAAAPVQAVAMTVADKPIALRPQQTAVVVPEPSSLPVHTPAAVSAIQAVAVAAEPAALNAVKRIVTELTGYDRSTLTGDMCLLDDLNMDSIKAAELLAMLAREFDKARDASITGYANATLDEIAVWLGNAGQPATAEPGIAEDEQKLLMVLAKITQFDIESLTRDMKLLDDLNMDSIKATEFLTLIANEYKLGNQLQPGQYANASIAEITQAIRGKPAHPDATNPQSEPVSIFTARQTWVRNFTEGACRKDLPAKPDASSWHGRHLWLVRAEGDKLASECAKYFGDTEARVTEVGFATSSEHRPPSVTDVLVIMPNMQDAVTESTLGEFIERLHNTTLAALNINDTGDKPRITYVQRYSRYPEREAENPVFSANAYASSLALEQPKLGVKVINLAQGALRKRSRLAKVIARELLVKTADVIVALDHQLDRWLPKYEIREPCLYIDKDMQWAGDDVVLVTGGGRGITAECALAFARQTGVKMALVGSSPLPKDSPQEDDKANEIMSVLARYDAEHLYCQYYSADITDAAAVAALVQQVEQELGPVTGLIHGAGLNQPRPINAVKAPAVMQESAPKVMGIAHLFSQLASEQLKLVVGFSSIIGVTGMRGNAWYGFANETLANMLAKYRQANPSTHVVSIAYSVWDEVGMGARLGSLDNLRKQGIGAIPVAEGVQRFLRLVSADAGTDQVIVTGRMGRYETWNSAARLPTSDSSQSYIETPVYYQAGVEAIVRRRLSLSKDAYLLDHNFKGSYLFPTVFGLEAMAQTVQLVAGVEGLESLAITNVSLERPITVSQNYDTEIEVYAEVLERETASDALRVRAGIRCDLSRFNRDHFSATFVLQALGDGPVHAVDVPEQALDIAKQGPLYGDILFQGPSFQRINTLHRLENPALGKGTCIFRSSYERNGFLLGDPYFRDSLLQSVQVIIPQDLSLPVSIDRIDIYAGAQGKDEVRTCVAYLNKREGDYYFATVFALAAGGRVLERLDGYRLKILETRDGTNTLEQLDVA